MWIKCLCVVTDVVLTLFGETLWGPPHFLTIRQKTHFLPLSESFLESSIEIATTCFCLSKITQQLVNVATTYVRFLHLAYVLKSCSRLSVRFTDWHRFFARSHPRLLSVCGPASSSVLNSTTELSFGIGVGRKLELIGYSQWSLELRHLIPAKT